MPYAQQPTSSELPVAAMAEGGKSSEKTEKTPLTAAIEGLAAPIESIEGMAPSHTVAAIEGFRTVMCAIIMAIHYQDFSGPHGRTPSMRASSGEWLTWAVLSADANFVVDICFIISGFVTELPSNVKFAPVTPMERARWMGHRLLRLAPLYYVTLFIWLLVHYFYVTPCSVHFLPLLYALVMGQAWSVFDETSNVTSSFAFAGHQSYFEGVESCPQESVVTSAAEINGPTWFVSCLVGCYLIHIVTAHLTMGEMFNATPYRSLSGAIVFSVVRAAQYLGTAGRRNWLVKYPPAAYCGFLAGAFTAKLVQQLPRDGTGVLGSKLWYFVDSGVVLIWTFSLIVTIDTIRFKVRMRWLQLSCALRRQPARGKAACKLAARKTSCPPPHHTTLTCHDAPALSSLCTCLRTWTFSTSPSP